MTQVTRREFARTAGAAGVAAAFSRLRVRGANDRINVGLIGCGNRGADLWKKFLQEPDVNPVAVCDVYEPYLRLGVELSAGAARGCKDFRSLLDMKEIDAVIVGTPDHWHALQTVMACEAGKDVFVEKPLSLLVREGRVMVQAARKNDRVVQVGSQQRSGSHYRRAVELIQGGEIGQVYKVSAGFARNVMPGFVPRKVQVEALDWDLWLGPAPLVPFDPFRSLYHFRWFWDYSGGQMTNWGAHHLDIARWATNVSGPVMVAGSGGRYAIEDGGETPDVQEVIYQFPGLVMTWTAREVNRGEEISLQFHGTRGTLKIDRGGFQILPETWKGDGMDDVPETEPFEERIQAPMDAVHIRNFLDCVKSRERPVADVEEGHLTAVVCHLGNIATRLGRSIRWDPQTETIAGDLEANEMLFKSYRDPWKLPV
jgi:predicted dehydrogenase